MEERSTASTYTPRKWEKKQTFYDLDYRHWYPLEETLQGKFRDSYKKYLKDSHPPTLMHIGSWCSNRKSTDT